MDHFLLRHLLQAALLGVDVNHPASEFRPVQITHPHHFTAVKVSFAPSYKKGPLSVGFGMEIGNFNALEQLGLVPNSKQDPYEKLQTDLTMQRLLAERNSTSFFEPGSRFASTDPKALSLDKIKQGPLGTISGQLPGSQPGVKLFDLTKPKYDLTITHDPNSSWTNPAFLFDVQSNKPSDPRATFRLSDRSRMSVLLGEGSLPLKTTHLKLNPSGKYEFQTDPLADFGSKPLPIYLQILREGEKPVKPEDLELSELFKSLPPSK